MRFSVPPGGMPTAPHVHPRQTETYRVERGALEVMVGDRWSLLREGESATVPPATPHAFRNRSGATVEFLNVHDPGLGFEAYFRAVQRLAADGRLKGGTDPRSMLYASLLMDGHKETIGAAGTVPRAAVRALALVALALGLRTD